MRVGRTFSLRLTLAFGGAVLIALLAIPVATGDRQEPADPAFGLDTGLLETGDLIFRRGESIASRLVLLADTQSVYSHVGLLLMGGSSLLDAPAQDWRLHVVEKAVTEHWPNLVIEGE